MAADKHATFSSRNQPSPTTILRFVAGVALIGSATALCFFLVRTPIVVYLDYEGAEDDFLFHFALALAMNFGPSVLLLIAGCALLPFSGRWQVLNGVWLIANVWGAVSFFLSGEVGWAALVGAIAVWIAWDMCRDLSQRFRSQTAPIKPALVKLVGLSWAVSSSISLRAFSSHTCCQFFLRLLSSSEWVMAENMLTPLSNRLPSTFAVRLAASFSLIGAGTYTLMLPSPVSVPVAGMEDYPRLLQVGLDTAVDFAANEGPTLLLLAVGSATWPFDGKMRPLIGAVLLAHIGILAADLVAGNWRVIPITATIVVWLSWLLCWDFFHSKHRIALRGRSAIAATVRSSWTNLIYLCAGWWRATFSMHLPLPW